MFQFLKLPTCTIIIFKPDVQEILELRLQITDHGENSKTIENHGKRVSLGNPFFTTEETTSARTGMHNQKPTVVVAVEKVKRNGPQVTHVPDRGHPTNEIEGIHCIGKKETEVWFRGHLFPELIDCMNASFDARLEAITELVITTSLSGNRTSKANHGFGHETTPELVNANWADTCFFVKSHEPVGHQSPDGSPGADVIGEPLSEAGDGFTESLAGCFVAKELELLGHISNCARGDQENRADRDCGVDREVGGGEVGVGLGMCGFKQLINGLAGVLSNFSGSRILVASSRSERKWTAFCVSPFQLKSKTFKQTMSYRHAFFDLSLLF